MKEDEAEKKWCPMARNGDFRGFDGGEPYGISNSPGETECCASDCMMWRFETLYGNMPSSGRIVEAGRSTTEGYCGLAGKE